MTLEKKLYSLRKRESLSQMDLAEKVNVSRQAVSRWELGDATPSMENLKSISSLYNISVDILLNDEVDLTDKDTQSIPQVSEEKETAMKRWSKQITAALLFLLVTVVVIVYIVATRSEQNTKVIPIDEMKTASEIQPSAGSFSIGW